MSIYDEHVRKQRRKSVANGFVWFVTKVGPFALALAVVLLIACGIRGWARSNDNAYAGYGPNRVETHNSRALGEWLLHDAEKTGQVKSVYATREAWATQYRLDNKTICVYVWGGSESDDNSQVEQGVCR